jgi:hypothetical protein
VVAHQAGARESELKSFKFRVSSFESQDTKRYSEIVVIEIRSVEIVAFGPEWVVREVQNEIPRSARNDKA